MSKWVARATVAIEDRRFWQHGALDYPGIARALFANVRAGLPQAPSLFDPFHRPQQAIARRDEVLRAMLGNGYITATQYADTVADRHLHLKAGRLYTRIREPYFFSYVRDELQNQYGSN